jgi:hypothetical protein
MYNFLSFVIPVAACVVCLVSLLGMDSANPMELANQLRNELRGAIGRSAR